MASARDGEDELSWWDRLRAPARGGDEDTSPPPAVGPADDDFGVQSRVRALLRRPLFAEGPPAETPTLRTAGAALLASAGLFGTPAPPYAAAAPDDQGSLGGGEPLPPSWKLPGRALHPQILGDGTALGAGPLPAVPGSGKWADIEPGAASDSGPALPRPSPAAPSATSPLDHPDARTGLALTAADALLRRGVAALAQVAGGDRALLQQVVDGAVAWLGQALPPEYHANAAKSGAAALADAESQILEDARAARTRAAIGALAAHRSEAERDFARALIEGDPTKLADARSHAVNAWAAERRARGDGEAEINAGARALDARYRRAALQHRLAQLDEPGIQRALTEDPAAKDDPVTARAAADEILRLRRADPARAGEATIEREIAARRRDGRIDTAADETAARYHLRLQAQVRRGVPEVRRRLLTNDERSKFAAEYLSIEAERGKDAAERWLDTKAQETGSHADRFRAELTISAPPEALRVSPTRAGMTPASTAEADGVAAAEIASAAPRLARQYAEAPGSSPEVSGKPRPAPALPKDDPRQADSQARADQYRSGVRDYLRRLAGKSSAEVDALIGDMLNTADTAQAEFWNPARRFQELRDLEARIDAAAGGNNRLRVYLRRGAAAAFDARSDASVEDAFIRGVSGVWPEDRANAEIAIEEERERKERQRDAEDRFSAFKEKRPNAGYPETLSEIVRIARETGALPRGALARLMPDLSPSRQSLGRLADLEKALAQLDALRAIARSGPAAEALPKSLRDLADDYDAVLREPTRPRDAEQLVIAVFQRGVPRRAAELAAIGEMAAEIVTPWGNIVSLNDARKSAQQAYMALAAGRVGEGLEKSGESLWYLAMAAPFIGNVRRGAKSAERLGESTGSRVAGVIPHMIDREGTDRFLRALRSKTEDLGYEIRLQQYETVLKDYGMSRRMDVHLVDPKGLDLGAIRFEVKTEGGKLTLRQIEADKKLRELGFEVAYVRVDLQHNTIEINGEKGCQFLARLRNRLKRRQGRPR